MCRGRRGGGGNIIASTRLAHNKGKKKGGKGKGREAENHSMQHRIYTVQKREPSFSRSFFPHPGNERESVCVRR